MNRDYYRALGVAENATDAQIKSAYRALARKYHPDKNKGDRQAEERFKGIGEAFAVLSDPKKRQQYDAMRKYGCQPGQAAAAGDGATGFGFDFSDIVDGFAGGDFSDWFSRATGGSDDRLETIEIPFAVAAQGGTVPVRFAREQQCAACHGTGAAAGVSVRTCPQCQGSGLRASPAGGFAFNRPCPLCCGRGSIIEQPCGTCHGDGTVVSDEAVSVTIPAGTVDGAKLRIPVGSRGRGRKRGGDLYVRVQVQPDRFFHADGYDVHCTVPVNFAQAALGTKLRVRTLDGFVRLTIPPGTQGGAKLRLRGRGIRRRNGTRGDQYVTIRVTVPEHLTDEQRQALAEFARRAGLKH